MINYDTYKKVQEMLKLGVKHKYICKNLSISQMQFYRYGLLPEDLFLNALQSQVDYQFETYRDYLISVLKVLPNINDTALLYKVKEEFSDFAMSRNTFFRHLKDLRNETGYIKNDRNTKGIKPELLPGYEGQVDFGQFKMVDMYGKSLRVYFFCMVLSYSRMKYCYFRRDPFTTKDAIEAHEYAFRYFGGRPQTLLYDQDRVFIVDDNFGDYMLVKEFEDYVRSVGFGAKFCHKWNPDTKGKVEMTVGYIKKGFLRGRIYEGIDSLNSSCLEWLDRFGNGDYHSVTKKIPRDVFINEEAKTLVKVKSYIKQTTFILTVDTSNCIRYQYNRYELDPALHLSGMRLKVVEENDEIFIYKPITNEYITKFKILHGEGEISTCKKITGKENIYPKVMQNIYGQDQFVSDFISKMNEVNPSYFVKSTRRLVRMTKYYTKDELYEGMKWCTKRGRTTIHELASFLIYKYGRDKAKVYLKHKELGAYTKRAGDIRREIDGRD